jgi:hypothetical protein
VEHHAWGKRINHKRMKLGRRLEQWKLKGTKSDRLHRSRELEIASGRASLVSREKWIKPKRRPAAQVSERAEKTGSAGRQPWRSGWKSTRDWAGSWTSDLNRKNISAQWKEQHKRKQHIFQLKSQQSLHVIHRGHRPPSLIWLETKNWILSHFYPRKLKNKIGKW